ncbi:MAG: C_GCAxxG_C_C family protein [Clostridia bacterium]|nr:C_GCAxxG_C_C family protein [Clostridia bacterium]
MSKYTDLAMERRSHFTPDGRPVYNCCQAAVSVFAEDAGFDEETAMKAATYFRGGMQTGSACGAITGSLMALGLSGLDDPAAANRLLREIKAQHDGMINCRDLLNASAERGEVKMVHCNGMICDGIRCTEAILRENGKLPDE